MDQAQDQQAHAPKAGGKQDEAFDQAIEGDAANGKLAGLMAGSESEHAQGRSGNLFSDTTGQVKSHYERAWETITAAVNKPGTVPEDDQPVVQAGLTIAKELVDSIRVLAGRN